MKKEICFMNVEKAMDFINKIRGLESNFDIVYGKQAIDAKSMLGVLSCDLSKTLIIECTIAEGEEDIVSKIFEEM